MQRYRIAVVSYINTRPFLHGLRGPEISRYCDLHIVHPARCAELMQHGEVDIALCPVGALQDLSAWRLITDFCIGCDGPVRTVSVYSEQPFNSLRHVVLSPESRTSNLLVKILDRDYWRMGLEFHDAHMTNLPTSGVGYLHIGDTCFVKEREFTHAQDLGQAWKEYTGLPFAFACWVAREGVSVDFEHILNTAFATAVGEIEKTIGSDDPDILQYLTQNISYRFDEPKKQALQQFLAASMALPGR